SVMPARVVRSADLSLRDDGAATSAGHTSSELPVPERRRFPWGHRWGHAVRISVILGMPVPLNHAVLARRRRSKRARLDSNQGPRNYEFPALTAELRARHHYYSQTRVASAARVSRGAAAAGT